MKVLLGTFYQEKALLRGLLLRDCEVFTGVSEDSREAADDWGCVQSPCDAVLVQAAVGWVLRWVRGGAGRRDLQAAVSHQPGPVHSKLPPHHHPL